MSTKPFARNSHKTRVPHSSQLHRDEWDHKPKNCALAFLLSFRSEAEKPAVIRPRNSTDASTLQPQPKTATTLAILALAFLLSFRSEAEKPAVIQPRNSTDASTLQSQPKTATALAIFALAFLLSFRSEAEKPAVFQPTNSTDTPQPKTVRIAVLTLFHPKTLTISLPTPTQAAVDGHLQTITTLTLTPGQTLSLPDATVTLTIPGKLTRTYRGALTVSPHNGVLLPVLTMDTELAVASIVAAESPPHAPFEALKAQAIASRSYLLATPPGPLYDATDTTHDQYLRSPPPPTSPAWKATAATRHIVLTWQPGATPILVRAMYSRSCGGHTRPHPSANPQLYPFYAVTCAFCLRHPEHWSRTATPSPTNESARITYNRTHGWSAIPSNTYRQTGSQLQGQGSGHGIGLCQLGAADLAAHGQTAARILALYYPNTTLRTLP